VEVVEEVELEVMKQLEQEEVEWYWRRVLHN
jgi:hypothetical protein